MRVHTYRCRDTVSYYGQAKAKQPKAGFCRSQFGATLLNRLALRKGKPDTEGGRRMKQRLIATHRVSMHQLQHQPYCGLLFQGRSFLVPAWLQLSHSKRDGSHWQSNRESMVKPKCGTKKPREPIKAACPYFAIPETPLTPLGSKQKQHRTKKNNRETSPRTNKGSVPLFCHSRTPNPFAPFIPTAWERPRWLRQQPIEAACPYSAIPEKPPNTIPLSWGLLVAHKPREPIKAACPYLAIPETPLPALTCHAEEAQRHRNQ